MLYVLCYIKDTNEFQICASIVMSYEIWFPNIYLNTSSSSFSSSFSSFSSSHNSCFIKVMALKMLFVVILIALSFVVEIDFGWKIMNNNEGNIIASGYIYVLASGLTLNEHLTANVIDFLNIEGSTWSMNICY